MNLISEYDAAIASGKINDDPQQRSLIPYFQELMDDLDKPQNGWFPWRPRNSPQGIYLYGSVGAGKTYLMDLFFQHLPMHSRGKIRLHFHHFMQQIDGQLRHLQGKANPLRIIAKHMAKKTRVLCLDEMLVNDVAHAMILAELFKHLFQEGIVLISTSNTAPDDLYANGVQRIRFLPAIEAIKQHCTVLQLLSLKDFRLERQSQYQAYVSPLNQDSELILDRQFRTFGGNTQHPGEILIQDRYIPYVKRAERVIWFDFNVICSIPRSQLDYLELSQKFSTIIVSNIPIIQDIDSAKAILLINFIDVLYDSKTRLIISAAAPLEELFATARPSFQRTYSRLQEMQSHDYF